MLGANRGRVETSAKVLFRETWSDSHGGNSSSVLIGAQNSASFLPFFNQKNFVRQIFQKAEQKIVFGSFGFGYCFVVFLGAHKEEASGVVELEKDVQS